MPKHLAIVVTIFLVSGNTFGQKVIFGKVSDGLTQEPLPYVNVFINNTTSGTSTDENGEYTLAIPAGEVEVVFSFVGYRSQKVTTSNAFRDAFEINIELFPFKQELQTVIVRDIVDKEWQKRLKQFQKVFLGDTYAARYCIIRNAWCIDLKREKISGKQVLMARASQPLEIENLALGYKLFYDLQNFSASREKDTFYGYVYFIELQPQDSVQAEIWARNRRDAYLGSSPHLFKSILSGRVSEEGYTLFTYSDPIDKTKPTAYTPSSVQFNAIKRKYRIPAEQKIHIRYNKKPAPKAPLAGSMNFTSGYADVDHQGAVLNPLGIITTGYISNLRVANLLPNNYEPPQSEFAVYNGATPDVTDLGLIPASSQVETADVHALEALDTLTKKATYYSENHPEEKVYMHFDRQFYVIGEDSWYKAYVVRGSDLNPTDISSVLYVDWIDPSGNIVSHKQLKIENGGAVGDFALDTTLLGGIYTVRAYTKWMRNEDPELFYSKKIQVFDPRTAQGKLDDDAGRSPIDLQFLPEGGTLVSGVKTRIAFKAIDGNGRGIDVQGKIIDDQNNFVTTFQSSYNGMGSFPFIGNDDKSFWAVLQTGEIYPLPRPVERGLSLSLSNLNIDKILVSVQSTAILDSIVYLIGRSRGSICYAKSIAVEATPTDISIPKDKLPEGILQLTLFDSHRIPQCERRLFIKKSLGMSVTVDSDKAQYAPRDSIALNLNINDADGNPAETKLSVVVSDADYTSVSGDPENIYTRLLLQSDLNGNVENPAWYFDSQTMERTYALDLVMLTHGWARYNWKEILDSSRDSIVFASEAGISLEGQILDNNKPVTNAPFLLMISQPGNEWINIYESDSLGKFQVTGLDFSDTTSVSWRVMREKKGVMKNAEIEMVAPQEIPPITDYGGNLEGSKDEFYEKILTRLMKSGEWTLKNAMILEEVVVKAPRMRVRAVGLETIGLKPSAEDLRARIPTSQFVNRYAFNLPFLAARRTPDGIDVWDGFAISINGFKREPSDYGGNPYVILNTIPIDEVDQIFVSGSAHDGYFIAIMTKNPTSEEELGTVRRIVKGYDTAREFYHPKYGPLATAPPGTDNRITLYWNPNLQTDQDGKATLKFYNTDSTQRYHITVEGIANGQPISSVHIIGKDN